MSPLSGTEDAVFNNYMTELITTWWSLGRRHNNEMRWDSAALTEIKMNAGNEGVDKEHEDHHTKDGHTLHQENLVSYSVLCRREKCSFYRQWGFRHSASLTIQMPTLHRSHGGQERVSDENLPSSATPGCFAPSSCPPARFACQTQQQINTIVFASAMVWFK